MTSRELTSGFDFWSRSHLRMAVHGASSHKIWCIYLYPVRSYWHFSKIQDGVRRHLGFFRLCEFGYSDVLTVWYLCSVPNWVKIYAWLLRSTQFASDVHLMTSRELTSGFDFWSRSHLRMAVMHLLVKFGADIFIQCGVIDILSKLKMAAVAILDLLGGAMGPPTKAHSWCVIPVKISSWSDQ